MTQIIENMQIAFLFISKKNSIPESESLSETCFSSSHSLESTPTNSQQVDSFANYFSKTDFSHEFEANCDQETEIPDFSSMYERISAFLDQEELVSIIPEPVKNEASSKRVMLAPVCLKSELCEKPAGISSFGKGSSLLMRRNTAAVQQKPSLSSSAIILPKMC